MLVLRVILYVGSTSALLALCVYIYLALRGDSPTLLSTSDADRMNWTSKVFLGLASIGFLVCMYQGAAAMLSWMPDSWGTIDEEGEFQTYRLAFSSLFASLGGVALLIFLDQATTERTTLRVLREQIEIERKIHSSVAADQLQVIKKSIENKIRQVETEIPREVGSPVRIECMKLRAYNESLHLIETRIAEAALPRQVRRAATDHDAKKEPLFD